jgi:ribosomal protein S16
MLRVDLERADYWLGVGAKPSEVVKKLIARARRNETAPAPAEEASA